MSETQSAPKFFEIEEQVKFVVLVSGSKLFFGILELQNQ